MSRHTMPDRLFSQAAIQYIGFNQTQAAYLLERWDNIQREPDDHPAKVECTFLEILTCFIKDSNGVWIDDDTAWFSSCETLCCDHSSALGLDQKSHDGLQDAHRILSFDYSGGTLSPTVDVAAPGMTVLYKATSEPRVCCRILNPFLDPEGNLARVEALDTPPPSDFSALSAMPYFGTSLKTAHIHAAYLKRRGNRCLEVAVVRLCIPKTAFQSLNSTPLAQAYFPSDDWKKLIWHFKRSPSNKELLRFKRATVVVGNVAGKPDKAFQKL
ncbi:hypothetical protein FCULG_00004990 [Fusarium culmorum]|uniref:Uncharacterized protein n=1 Tax=Fusarium culmorum TaxID=5516 RepID=A0A2T4H9Q8_FUSCU|nr:hypothetical protein FCULG_00004990 [Fusarium culmorum]